MVDLRQLLGMFLLTTFGINKQNNYVVHLIRTASLLVFQLFQRHLF